MNPNANLSKNIAFLRKRAGMTQKRLSVKLVVSHKSIGSWEEFRCKPPLEMMIKISDLFRVSIDDLIRLDLEQAYSWQDKILTINDNESINNIGIGRDQQNH